MSVISIPLLLDRPEANVIEAIIKSFEAVQFNFFPLLLWAALIVIFIIAGLVTFFLGLVVVLPLLSLLRGTPTVISSSVRDANS